MLLCCNQQTDKGIYNFRQNRNVNRIWNNVKKDLKQMWCSLILNVRQKKRCLWQRNNATTGSGSLFFQHKLFSVIASKRNVVNVVVYQCVKAWCLLVWFTRITNSTRNYIRELHSIWTETSSISRKSKCNPEAKISTFKCQEFT